MGLVACGLTYAPGDFLSRETTTTHAAAPIVEAGAADAAVPFDAAEPVMHVMLFGGTVVNETIVATIAADGTLGPWTFDEPPPSPGAWKRAILANGKIYLEGPGVFAEATFDGHITSPFTRETFPVVPSSIEHGWLVDPYKLHASSALSKTQLSATIFDDGGVGTWGEGIAAAAVVRTDATIVRIGSFVYALGGRGTTADDPATIANEVELATYDADGGVFGDFALISDAGASVFAPVVAASDSRIVVAGGADETGLATSAVVHVAQVTDATTGALTPWITLPALPEALAGFAIVVTATSIVIFGGVDASGAFHDEVLALAIVGGASWTQIGTLPGTRAGLTAVTF